ncbi:hypothetical protein TNCV_52931 [Trichonephila clavipes]|nr:hypothetical protein TNCV_52931 [Trichonephila clavipes]
MTIKNISTKILLRSSRERDESPSEYESLGSSLTGQSLKIYLSRTIEYVNELVDNHKPTATNYPVGVYSRGYSNGATPPNYTNDLQTDSRTMSRCHNFRKEVQSNYRN